jgi:hypothetical protein
MGREAVCMCMEKVVEIIMGRRHWAQEQKDGKLVNNK